MAHTLAHCLAAPVSDDDDTLQRNLPLLPACLLRAGEASLSEVVVPGGWVV